MPHPHPLLPQHLLYLLILNHLLPVILPSSSTGFLIPVFFFEHPVPAISIATILPVKTKTFPLFPFSSSPAPLFLISPTSYCPFIGFPFSSTSSPIAVIRGFITFFMTLFSLTKSSHSVYACQSTLS